MPNDATDVHALDPERFIEEVHSFQHWFDSVEGYLSDLDFGHRRGLETGDLEPGERDRLVSALCTYSVGEMAALEGASGLLRIAPNQACKVFLSTQVVDEGRHVEVIHHRLRELGVDDPDAEVERRAGASIRNFRRRLLELVDAGEWEAAIFAQNVALEAMEYTVFQAHARIADPVTRDMLERILRDERRHMGFGENALGRRIAADPRARVWIRTVKGELDQLVLETFEQAFAELGVPRSQRPALGAGYLQIVERLGFDR